MSKRVEKERICGYGKEKGVVTGVTVCVEVGLCEAYIYKLVFTDIILIVDDERGILNNIYDTSLISFTLKCLHVSHIQSLTHTHTLHECVTHTVQP